MSASLFNLITEDGEEIPFECASDLFDFVQDRMTGERELAAEEGEF